MLQSFSSDALRRDNLVQIKLDWILCCRLYWGQCLEYAVLDYSFHCNPGNTYQPNRNIFFISPQLGLPLLISVAMPLMWHTISPGSFSNDGMGTSTFTCKISKLYPTSKLFNKCWKYYQRYSKFWICSTFFTSFESGVNPSIQQTFKILSNQIMVL